MSEWNLHRSFWQYSDVDELDLLTFCVVFDTWLIVPSCMIDLRCKLSGICMKFKCLNYFHLAFLIVAGFTMFCFCVRNVISCFMDCCQNLSTSETLSPRILLPNLTVNEPESRQMFKELVHDDLCCRVEKIWMTRVAVWSCICDAQGRIYGLDDVLLGF